jgi:tetratricopeptide (TPR) repeat protein
VRHYRWWYGTLVCFALLGCAVLPGRGPVFLACTVVGYAASVVLFFVAERYRLPLVPLLATAAAAGAGAALHALRSGDKQRTALLGTLVAAAALVVFPDWHDAGRERISADGQMGQIFLMRGEPDRALEHIERARIANRRDPDLLNLLGSAHFQRGDVPSAEAAYLEALELGDFSSVWYNLGVAAERKGPQYRGLAAERYRRALAANPADTRARANLEAIESR